MHGVSGTYIYEVRNFAMTIGIALSVKSNLGVSPVSSIPYTITCVWGLEMGKATILFHVIFVLIQLLLLQKTLSQSSYYRFRSGSHLVSFYIYRQT